MQRAAPREGGARQGAGHELGWQRCRDVHRLPMPRVDLHRRDLELRGRVDDEGVARGEAVVRLAELAPVGTLEALVTRQRGRAPCLRAALRAARLDDVVRHVPSDHPVQPRLLLELGSPGSSGPSRVTLRYRAPAPIIDPVKWWRYSAEMGTDESSPSAVVRTWSSPSRQWPSRCRGSA